MFHIFYRLHIFSSVSFSESPESLLPLNVRYLVVHIHTHIHTKLVEYNSRQNLECYCLLVSKKHVKIRTFVNINVTTHLTLDYNLSYTRIFQSIDIL